MSKCEKLLEKAKSSPNNLRFTELCKLAECYGFDFRRQDGTSHRIYSHTLLHSSAGGHQNFQDDGGKAVPYQVRQLLRAIDALDTLKDE